MNTYKNVLSKGLYLINPNLQEFLQGGSSNRYDGRFMNKNINGKYLVLIRVLNNNDSKTIIYNYIFYPDIFNPALLYFLLEKKDFRNSTLYSEWGDYLTILYHKEFTNDRLCLNEKSDYFIKWLDYKGLYSDIEIKNYVDLYLLINVLTYVTDYDILCDLIDLAIKKNYKGFSAKIFNYKNFYSPFNRTFRFNIENISEKENINIINGCLFVVDNLNVFISNLRNKGYIINAGPQKWRGQVNSMNNFLTCLDIDFRYSLYKHNQYHVVNNGLDAKYNLTKSKFSYRNIHQNIGGVRW